MYFRDVSGEDFSPSSGSWLIWSIIKNTRKDYLGKTTYLTLRKDYLFNHSNCSHPSIEVVVYLFLSLKGWQSPIVPLYHCCHSLSLIAICCHSLSLVASVAVTLCHSLYHSLSFVVICCHSLSFVVTRCTTLCQSLPVVVTRCHSFSLDVPLACIFINDRYLSL